MAQRDRLVDTTRPVIEDLGYELVGIEHLPRPGNALVRIYIDHDQGIGLDDCEKVSREVSAVLDVDNPIAGHYTLEVSSPGLDRPLFEPAHFARFVGEEARVTLARPTDGRRKLKGEIVAVNGSMIAMDVEGERFEFEHASVVKARLIPDI